MNFNALADLSPRIRILRRFEGLPDILPLGNLGKADDIDDYYFYWPE
jgi:hypothetical protein